MKKIGLILLFVMCVTLVSCSEKNESKGYTITWKNIDEEILEVDENVSQGSMPSFDGKTPTMESDGQFDYVFSGWEPNLVEVTEDKVYYATFEKSYLHSEYNGSYVLKQIITEKISSGDKTTYKLGDFYFGVRLVKENIEAEIASGVGNMSFNFDKKVSNNITYDVFEDKIVMYCEEGIDLFGKGNYQYEFDILIERVDENTYFVLQASNGYYNFSYYLVAEAEVLQ
jgi:hypothetical protein